MKDVIYIELGEIFHTTSGGTPSRKNTDYFTGNIPWVKSGELKNNIILESEEYISTDAVKNSSAKIFPKGTLLLALYGATIGKLAFLGIEATTNQAICGIFENKNILHKFTYYYLLFKKPLLIEQGVGGAQPNISQTIVKKLLFPVIPLLAQQVIVAKIEELFSELDNGIENLQTALAKLKIYRQAVLKKAFEGEFTREWRERQTNLQTAEELFKTIKQEREIHYQQQLDEWKSAVKEWEKNGQKDKKPGKPKAPYISLPISEEETTNSIPSGWMHIRFLDLVKYEENAIKRGPFGSAIKKAFFVDTGYKVYEQQNAINDSSSLGNYFINDKKFEELKNFSVKSGDYIVSCSGTIGRIHKLDKNCQEGVINQALMKIVLDENLMKSMYFLYLFRSEVFQRKILKGTRGTGMQNLASIDEIKEIILFLPTLDEQDQIIQEIESRLSLCDKIEETISNSLAKAESLRQSILKKAFEGNLLTSQELEAIRNHPDYESAEELLKRIKQERKQS